MRLGRRPAGPQGVARPGAGCRRAEPGPAGAWRGRGGLAGEITTGNCRRGGEPGKISTGNCRRAGVPRKLSTGNHDFPLFFFAFQPTGNSLFLLTFFLHFFVFSCFFIARPNRNFDLDPNHAENLLRIHESHVVHQNALARLEARSDAQSGSREFLEGFQHGLNANRKFQFGNLKIDQNRGFRKAKKMPFFFVLHFFAFQPTGNSFETISADRK